jgi:hypothetical protein
VLRRGFQVTLKVVEDTGTGPAASAPATLTTSPLLSTPNGEHR